MPNKFSILFLTAICVLILSFPIFASSSSDTIWQEVEEATIRQPETERTVYPTSYKVFRADTNLLRSTLGKAPAEFGKQTENDLVLTLPLPNGTFSRFKIQYSPIMEPELAAKYPELKTYIAQDIDNPHSTARISMTPTGFRAAIFSGYKTVMIDPYSWGDSVNYISYDKAMLTGEKNFTCLTGDDIFANEAEKSFFFDFSSEANLISNGGTLRVYRLALAATAEYTNVFRQANDTDAQAKSRALEQQVIILTRVNGVYERDLAIRMVLVAQNDLIIYTDPTTDPYSNTEGSKMLGENQETIDRVILPPNYELGHVFSTGGGGLANIGASCRDSNKARGVTGLFNPRGDPFAIDYVAHELGHQWGANHTFNGGGGNCDGNRSAGSAYEPGSGVTIMGYAGICSGQDLARNSLDSFHFKSIESILNYINNGSGNCSVNVSIENSIPVVTLSAGSSFDIPKETPFALSATASDANGDSVTYDWQQYDLGTSTSSVPNTDSDGAARPIFRAYSPTTSGTRYFPSLQYILNNANVPPSTYVCGRTTPCLIGETLPSIARTMNFQVIVRDNRIGGGAVSTAGVQVRVDGASGPFKVTVPNSSVTMLGGSNQTITWDAAKTAAAPINTANVRILLSTDGGQNFTTVLSNSTPNDGSHTVTIPNVVTSQARIKIEAVGNIFFDISDANFSISATQVPSPTAFDFDGDGKADISVFRPAESVWYLLRTQAGFTASQFGNSTDKTTAADYDADGKTDLAVFRSGNWFWFNSSTSTFGTAQFGQTGDTPITGDYDGDGKNDLTIFRNGVWFILQTTNGMVRATQFGQTDDKPVTGDFDGDGRFDLAVYRSGTWFILASRDGFSAIPFGIAGDKPVPEDFDGDGKTDLAVYRGGIWHLLRSRDGYTGLQFGVATDTPAAADFDGDGKADISVYRGGSWFLLNSQAGFAAVAFGTATDQPIPAQLN